MFQIFNIYIHIWTFFIDFNLKIILNYLQNYVIYIKKFYLDLHFYLDFYFIM